jgi:outer membrane protein
MRALYLTAGCLMIATTVGAQAPTVLTLERALELAHQRNPAYLRALAQADASGASVRAGFGAFLPSLSASLGWSGSQNTTMVGQDDFGRPITGDSSVTFKSSGANQGVSTSVTLFDGFQNVNNYRAAQASADAASATVSQQAVAVEAEVARRFYSALQARRLIAVEEQLLAVSRRQLDATDRLFRVAARTEVDVLGAQVQVAQQEQALEQARGDARRADLLLAEAIGLEDHAELELVGSLREAFDPTAFDADSLVQVGFQQSPVLARARADAAEAGFSAGAAKGRYWPTITANANFNRSQNTRNFDSFFDFNPQDNRGLGVGLNVQIPIFNRFASRDAVAQAVARSRVADENLREAELQLERSIRSAFIDVGTAYRRLQLAQRAVDLSRRRLTMAQEQYQLGTIGFTDFQQIVTQTSQDARQLINAELEFSRALVTLEESVGRGVGR